MAGYSVRTFMEYFQKNLHQLLEFPLKRLREALIARHYTMNIHAIPSSAGKQYLIQNYHALWMR